MRGIAGWRGLNTVLASALTGWRIRLEPVATTAAWQRLHTALLAKRTITARLVGPSERGWRVEVLGLYAVLSRTARLDRPRPGQDVQVCITRMDPDEGRIFVSDRLAPTGQLRLL